MFFASDNSGPVHPEVMDALTEANSGYAMGYGAEPLMDEVRARIRTMFEAPEAEVFLVATGTAANALALSAICRPWQTIYCTPASHIENDECNAPEFYTGGAKLTLLPDHDKLNINALQTALASAARQGIHNVQRGPVAITQVTECGTIYTLDEIRAIAAAAKRYDLPVHLDGARFSNAVVALDCTPAEMSWKAGVDVVSFGGTKNGLMAVEAVVFFDPSHATEFELRRKRGAHLFSKHRYLAAQMTSYLRDDLWRRSAQAANANTAHLVAGLRQAGAVFRYEPQANMVFAALPRAVHQRLHAGGAVYSLEDGALEGADPEELITARFVCDWSISQAQIDRFLALVRG